MKTSEANIEDLKGMVVSDGTMRSEDLIPKFLNVLKVYGRDVYDKYVGENPEVLDLSGMDDETMGWVVDELFDKLNEIAPEGYSFGSQDGDGACYGFWSVDADERKKCETYIQPVTLYSTTHYDDAEAVQSFLRDIGGDAVTVDKQRNGDVLSVNVSGSDDDVEAFVDTYKNEYGSIVKDCEVDATGWTAPEDIYYIATEQGRKELRGESKKQESEEPDAEMVAALHKKADDDKKWFGEIAKSFAKELDEVGLDGFVPVFRPKEPYSIEDRYAYNVEWQPYDKNGDYVKNAAFKSKTYGFVDCERLSDGRIVVNDYRPLDEESIEDFANVVVSGGTGDEGIFLWVLDKYKECMDKTESKKSEAKKPEDKEYNVYVGHYELIITDKVLDTPYELIDSRPLYDNLEDDLLVDYPSATIIYDQDIKDEVISNVYPWLEGESDISGVQFADFSEDAVKMESKKSEATDLKGLPISEADFEKIVKAYCKERSGEGSVPELVEINKVVPIVMDNGEVEGYVVEFAYYGSASGMGMISYAVVYGDPSKNRDGDTIAFLHNWDSVDSRWLLGAKQIDSDEVAEKDWELANDYIKPREVIGESKKSETKEDKPVWGVTVEYTPVNGETRRTDVAPSCSTAERAKEAAIARVTKDYGPLEDVKIIRVDRLPEWAARNIRDLVRNNKTESMSNRIENTTITEQEFSDILNAYVKEIEGTDIKPIRIEVLKTEPVEGDGTLIKFHYDARENGWSNARTYALVFGDLHKNRENDLIYVLHDWQSGEKVTPEDTADHDWELVNNHIRPSEILDATKSSESLDSSIDVKGHGVVELSEDDYLKLSRDINSRGYCKDKAGGYNVWIGGSFKGKFPSVEAAADAGYTLVEGKRCEAQVSEKTFKQGVDEFIGAAPEGGWSDYWAMQQDWEFYKDSLCRDGVITQKQADSWSNPCTPETFDRWQKRNGLVHRGYESKKSEARPTKQEAQIKELCKLCRNDKNVAESVFKALTKDYNTSLDPVLAGQYLTAKWKSKLEELGGCNGWYDGFKKLYAAMGSDFVCSVLQDLKLGSSGIGCGACITIVNNIYDKVVKRNEAKKSEDFDMNKALFQAKKAITDWTKRQGHKTLEWLYTDGRKSPTSYPSGIWDFEWDTGNGMATAELKVSPYETRTNSWNDSMDFSLRAGTEDKPTFYTSVEDVLDALDTLISKTEIKMESKKSESLILKQKELKDMARYGEAEDITTISDVEAKELKKKGIETVGISRGVYGMNGALFRDCEGKKYVITARSSNLFYFV